MVRLYFLLTSACYRICPNTTVPLSQEHLGGVGLSSQAPDKPVDNINSLLKPFRLKSGTVGLKSVSKESNSSSYWVRFRLLRGAKPPWLVTIFIIDLVFHAIAEPRRREILGFIRDIEHTSGEIAAHFEVTRPAISQQLQVLLSADPFHTIACHPITYHLFSCRSTCWSS